MGLTAQLALWKLGEAKASPKSEKEKLKEWILATEAWNGQTVSDPKSKELQAGD